ncbi:4-diphosphocytidyl-2-C-methyl-D-erythritol kinase [Caldanaerobius fijiensis DSM 17918]|uniref:4-diphosphocytidyl-2-C-methyl-D-erythritol kinase n=1 Tax=Caldanaerobius fijiensis DSM 17918 TaxID=1121256 RepID=A0A1M4Z5V0_9THEO|nr:4-(cytidine 5'-diphospho)-2-C-methyl-D-erythritol kinase [Caldanaerobius fijiensis]SHF13328.1 4-diphosphocytidyl-2-C-methyl-D-erythritol kinase [Caldanaerobius fijiensis DSM 17918]
MKIKAYAKVNLSLNVLDRRSDGYHHIETIMQSINLYDVVQLEKSSNGIQLTCEGIKLPCDSRNIAYKAAELMIKRFRLQGGIKIHIQKHIPVAAGLAGGSTDAAAVIKGINKLYGLNLNDKDLSNIGLEIGADVPFCIKGGTGLAMGIGEEIVPLPTPKLDIVLIKPGASASTKVIYQLYDELKEHVHPDVRGQAEAIIKGDLKKVCKLAANGLEAVTMKICPEVVQAKKALIDSGCEVALMSGSGTAVYGIYRDKFAAQEAYRLLKRNYLTFLVKTIDEESANG